MPLFLLLFFVFCFVLCFVLFCLFVCLWDNCSKALEVSTIRFVSLHFILLYFHLITSNRIIIFQRTKMEQGHLGNDLSLFIYLFLFIYLSLFIYVFLFIYLWTSMPVFQLYFFMCISYAGRHADCTAEWSERLTQQKGEYFKVNKSSFE